MVFPARSAADNLAAG